MKKATILLFLIGAVALAQNTNPPPDDPMFTKFKRLMMPQVGKQITVTGTLESCKLGWCVPCGGWRVYIYVTKLYQRIGP